MPTLRLGAACRMGFLTDLLLGYIPHDIEVPCDFGEILRVSSESQLCAERDVHTIDFIVWTLSTPLCPAYV